MIKNILLSSMFIGFYKYFKSYTKKIEVRLLLKSLKKFGENVKIQLPVKFCNAESISIGSDVSIAAYVHIWGAGGVRIGDRTMIGSHSSISTLTHDYNSNRMFKTVVKDSINIENDVWIGTHSIILPGVTIGKGSVVGAGAFVNHDVLPYSIVAGVPARLIGKRDGFTNKNGSSATLPLK